MSIIGFAPHIMRGQTTGAFRLVATKAQSTAAKHARPIDAARGITFGLIASILLWGVALAAVV